MSEMFLPMQLIHQRNTDRCLPKVFESKAMQHLQMVLFPYVEKMKVELKLPEDQKAMLIFDVFKGQITDKVTKFIEENNCVIVHIPNNMTDEFQPLDLNVSSHSKELLKGKFERWYAQQITNQLEGGSIVYNIQYH